MRFQAARLACDGEIRSGAKGNQFEEGRHLSPISSKGGFQPIMCCQPARSGEGRFLAVSPGLFSDSVVRYFVSGFWSWLSWLCDQGIVQDSDRLLQNRLVARRNCKVPTPTYITLILYNKLLLLTYITFILYSKLLLHTYITLILCNKLLLLTYITLILYNKLLLLTYITLILCNKLLLHTNITLILYNKLLSS